MSKAAAAATRAARQCCQADLGLAVHALCKLNRVVEKQRTQALHIKDREQDGCVETRPGMVRFVGKQWITMGWIRTSSMRLPTAG